MNMDYQQQYVKARGAAPARGSAAPSPRATPGSSSRGARGAPRRAAPGTSAAPPGAAASCARPSDQKRY